MSTSSPKFLPCPSCDDVVGCTNADTCFDARPVVKAFTQQYIDPNASPNAKQRVLQPILRPGGKVLMSGEGSYDASRDAYGPSKPSDMLDYNQHLKFSMGTEARIALRKYWELTGDNGMIDNLNAYERALADEAKK